MLKSLRVKPIRNLWMGQALSSIGDEIYRVGLTWIAVGLIGADTGYLNCAQLTALMVFSFVGGKWADHWDPLKTMKRIDTLRGLIVLIPVVYSFFAPVSLPLLVVVAIVISSLGAFFDPALQTVLPAFSPDIATLQSATGLMMTTIRLARMVGPGFVGVLATLIPPIQFFTMDALSFFVSLQFLRTLPQAPNEARLTGKRVSFAQAFLSGFQLLNKNKNMRFIVWTKAFTGGTWNLGFSLCYALLVQEIAGNDTRSFGFTVAAYGAGNFAGALYFGNKHRKRPALMMFIGYLWLGAGFIMNAFCTTIPWLMATAAFAAFSGTMNEVTFFDLVQTQFSRAEISKIVRFRVAGDTFVTLVLMLMAPVLIRFAGVRWILGTCGVLWILTGLAGIFHPVRKNEIQNI